MASKLDGIYKKVLSFASNHEESFISLLTIVAVSVVEKVSFDFAFQCPCTHIRASWYGIGLLICPALILGMLSILSHQFLWRRVKSTGECFPCPACCKSFGRATLPFFSWIILVLIDGRVPECFFTEVSSDCSNITNTTSSLLDTFKPMGNTSATAISQFVGMVIALVYVALVLIVMACNKKKSKGYQEKFFQEYEKQEQLLGLKNLKEKAQKIAENDVGVMVNCVETLQPSDWIAIQACETDNTTERTEASETDNTTKKTEACGADTEASETVNISWSGLHNWAIKNRSSASPASESQPPASGSQPLQPPAFESQFHWLGNVDHVGPLNV